MVDADCPLLGMGRVYIACGAGGGKGGGAGG